VSSSEPTQDQSKANAHLSFSESPGRVVIYQGTLPRGNDQTKVLKVVIPNAPTLLDVALDMDASGGVLGTPSGNIHAHVSAPTEVRMLSQSKGSRSVGAFVVKDFDADWGTRTFRIGADCNFNPLDGPVGCDVRLALVEVAVKGSAAPGLRGFLNIYTVDRTPHFIMTAPELRPRAYGEYVPSLTFLANGLTSVDAGVGIGKCLSYKIPPNLSCYNGPFNFIAHGTVEGGFNFDWWDQGGFPWGNEDYVENEPWHLLPLIQGLSEHDFGTHVKPFAD
jgi:hypothetical protein